MKTAYIENLSAKPSSENLERLKVEEYCVMNLMNKYSRRVKIASGEIEPNFTECDMPESIAEHITENLKEHEDLLDYISAERKKMAMFLIENDNI